MTTDVEMRAYRFALDLTPRQEQQMREHAGAARWAYNYALAQKYAALSQRQQAIAAMINAGIPAKLAAANAPRIPNKQAIQKALNRAKGDDRLGIPGDCPWWHTVSTYAFQSAMVDADQAWQNWIASVTGARRGKAIAQPRFKRKNRSPDSFRIHHNVQCPTIRPDGYRRISVPRLGSLRLHGSNKRLCRALKQGAVVQSITVSRGGHRWYASVLTKQTIALPGPSRRQLSAGVVGVDAGVLHLGRV